MENIQPQDTDNSKPKKPPVNDLKYISEVLASLAAMAIAGALSYAIFVPAMTADFRRTDCMGGFAALVWWIFLICPILLPLSAATAVYRVGTVGDQTGSFSATLGWSFLGVILAAVVAVLSMSWNIGIVLLPLSSSLGAVIGFNRTRRFKSTKMNEKHVPSS